jgi:hypothetical protein
MVNSRIRNNLPIVKVIIIYFYFTIVVFGNQVDTNNVIIDISNLNSYKGFFKLNWKFTQWSVDSNHNIWFLCKNKLRVYNTTSTSWVEYNFEVDLNYIHANTVLFFNSKNKVYLNTGSSIIVEYSIKDKKYEKINLRDIIPFQIALNNLKLSPLSIFENCYIKINGEVLIEFFDTKSKSRFYDPIFFKITSKGQYLYLDKNSYVLFRIYDKKNRILGIVNHKIYSLSENRLKTYDIRSNKYIVANLNNLDETLYINLEKKYGKSNYIPKKKFEFVDGWLYCAIISNDNYFILERIKLE